MKCTLARPVVCASILLLVSILASSVSPAAARSNHAAGVTHNVTSCAGTAPGWLHTQGPWVVDSKGKHVRLAGVTWDGMQTTTFIPGGLQYQPYTAILCTIKNLGFNTVRIPLSDQLVYRNSSITITQDIAANPDLAGLHPLGVLDRIVAAAQHDGLMIILDNHFSMPRYCSLKKKNCLANGNPQGGPGTGTPTAWTDSGYNEQTWIADWTTLANRYSDAHPCGLEAQAAADCGPTPTVIGFDLHNEPHTNFGHHRYNLNDYLTRGATWGPYPNALHPDPRWKLSSDWAAGADLAGSTILTTNPHLLMFVEGVQLYPDKTQPRGVEVYTWGGIFRGVQTDPIVFTNLNTKQPITDQLVYSPHEWGPWKDNLLGEFSYRTTYKTLLKIFMENWAFLLHQKSPVPIWLGEFDTCNYSIKKCVSSTSHGKQGQWFQLMLEFLKKNPQVGWSYYTINGTNWLNEAENNSILNPTWTAVKLPALMTALQTVQH